MAKRVFLLTAGVFVMLFGIALILKAGGGLVGPTDEQDLSYGLIVVAIGALCWRYA